jgi:hypothetical protein
MADYVTPVITLVGGFVLGWFGHLLTRKDAAETRKLNFLGFMEGWRTEIERKNLHVVADQFSDKCADFRSEAAKIRSDCELEFWELVDSLSSLREGEIKEGENQGDNAPGKIKVLTRLDAVMNFVKAN